MLRILKCTYNMSLASPGRTFPPFMCSRFVSNASSTRPTPGEERISDVLRQKFPNATCVKVQDVSGGCGSMYEIHLESEEFRGLRIVAQHMMVNKALEKEIREMHGLRINTATPGGDGS